MGVQRLEGKFSIPGSGGDRLFAGSGGDIGTDIMAKVVAVVAVAGIHRSNCGRRCARISLVPFRTSLAISVHRFEIPFPSFSASSDPPPRMRPHRLL